MSVQLQPHCVRLDFGAQALVSQNLSGAVFVGEDLWVAGDEACALTRLTRLAPTDGETLHFGAATDFPLSACLDLPDAADVEADIEGLDVQDGWLWLTGSHGLKRKNPKRGRSAEDNLARLATLARDGNRCLLARIPIENGPDGCSRIVREAADGRRAAVLRGSAQANELTDALIDDPHFGPFMGLPGKDNGFDIEGLAVRGEQILLGLRGPVLRGWSALLDIRCETRKGELRLLRQGRVRVRKHFLRLDGLGVRDLHWEGEDLILLAGPTMVLDGEVRLYRWRDAAAALAASDAPEALWEDVAEAGVMLPHVAGGDRAEALTRVPPAMLDTPDDAPPTWLVLHDAPAAARVPRAGQVFADLLR